MNTTQGAWQEDFLGLARMEKKALGIGAQVNGILNDFEMHSNEPHSNEPHWNNEWQSKQQSREHSEHKNHQDFHPPATIQTSMYEFAYPPVPAEKMHHFAADEDSFSEYFIEDPDHEDQEKMHEMNMSNSQMDLHQQQMHPFDQMAQLPPLNAMPFHDPFTNEIMYHQPISSLPSTELLNMGVHFAAPAAGPAVQPQSMNPRIPIPLHSAQHMYHHLPAFNYPHLSMSQLDMPPHFPIKKPIRAPGQPTNIETTEKLDRKTLKRLRNRVSASRCRVKKKIWLNDLEGRNEIMKEHYSILQDKARMLHEALVYCRNALSKE